MAFEHSWNLNILCVDSDEDILKLYQDVLTTRDRAFSITKRYRSGSHVVGNNDDSYQVFSSMSGIAATRIAMDFKQKEMQLAVGFFDIGIEGKTDGLECIREVKRIFPDLLCAVVTEMNDESVGQIRKIFDSQDEWLYIKKPFTKEEVLQTACNLIVSWNLRNEQSIAMQKIEDSQGKMQRLLGGVTPKLFRIQTEEELSRNVVEEVTDIMETEHAFMAMKVDGKMEFMAGTGKFSPKAESDKQKYMNILNNRSCWSQECLPVPISVRDEALGLLFLDGVRAEHKDTEILELFTSQAAYAFENIKIQAEKEEQKMREQELKIGQLIQESLLPKTIPASNDIELYGLMHSAKEIGGDYYDFLHREIHPNVITEDIFVSIGDVAGKGVAAGLIMSEVRSFIRALTPFYSSPKQILDQVARLLEKDIWGTGKFMSLLLMLWDSKKKRFLFSSAGHEHIIHYQARFKKCKVFKAGGVVLGLKYDIVSPHLKEQELIMAQGDAVVLFTDGATEAMDEQEKMFTLERLVALTEQYAHLAVDQLLDNLYQHIENFIGKHEQFDDITMAAIKKK